MLYNLHILDQDTLKSEITTLIEAERDFTTPRHVALTRMINELSVTGFPLLVDTARALLDEDRLASEWTVVITVVASVSICVRID